MRSTGMTLSVIGAVLIVLSLLGELTTLGDYESAEPRPWEAFDSALVARTPTYDSLLQEAAKRAGGDLRELPSAQAMDALFSVTVDRFSHKAAHHNAFSNWILWMLGAVHPALSHIRDENTLVEKGHSMLCGQVSYVLTSLANDVGIPSRHVGLNGHVVMEAFYDGGWHAYDPDFEVVATTASGRVLSVDELAARRDVLEAAYGPGKAVAIPLILSTEDNTFMSYPPNTWFVWKSQVLYLLEKAANYLKYLVPLTLLAVGALLVWSSGRAQDRPQARS